MGKRLPWFKVYDDYFTSPSHAELDGDALLVGIAIMAFIRATCDALGELQPWALLPTGKPVTSTGFATKARKTVEVIERSVSVLLDTGTFIRREDGAIGMPNFEPRQQADSTPRSQKSRALRRSDGAPPSATPTPARSSIAVPSSVTPGAITRAAELELLREKLTYGWGGHPPPQPKGLPTLRLHLKGIEPLLESGMTAAQILSAVDQVAELVDAGELPVEDWTSTKVFSGWLDSMRVAHAKWSRKRKSRPTAEAAHESDAPPMDPAALEAAASKQLKKLQGDKPCSTN